MRDSPLCREAQEQGPKLLPLNLFSAWRESGWADRVHSMTWRASIGPGQRAPGVVSRRLAVAVKDTILTRLAEPVTLGARALVEQDYTAEHVVKRALACYRKVLG